MKIYCVFFLSLFSFIILIYKILYAEEIKSNKLDKIFEKNTTYLALRKGQFLKGFVAKFVCLCINNLTIEDLNLKILNTNNVVA